MMVYYSTHDHNIITRGLLRIDLSRTFELQIKRRYVTDRTWSKIKLVDLMSYRLNYSVRSKCVAWRVNHK